MSPRASTIASFLGKPLIGPDCEIDRPRSASLPEPNSLVFAKTYSAELVQQLNTCPDVLVIACPDFAGRLTTPHVLSDHPRLDFARAVHHFFAPERPRGITPTAQVAATARIGADVYIGNFTVVEAHVEIGAGTVVYDHVVIRKQCIIGKCCLIKSNTVIGEEGFGFEFDEEGRPVRIPHLGRVVIGDHVEVGAVNVIARGTLDDTIIGDSVKIDDHVFVAHNVRIGSNTVVTAGAEISGSVLIGRNAWIGPQAAIINQVTLGERALVGIGAVVTKSVEPNMVVVGNPARVLRTRDIQE